MKYSNVYIKPTFCFGCSLLLLLIPLKWVLCWIVAAAVHELGHYIALRYLNVQIEGITIGLNGAVMETGNMTRAEEAVCSAAGPLFGISLLFLRRQFPTIAICAFLQSLYNFLPIFPLDGGRVIRALVVRFVGEKLGNRISVVIGAVAISALNIFAGYLWIVLGFGPIPLICVLFFSLRHIRKITCKDAK